MPNGMTTATVFRELAHRVNDGLEVALLWSELGNRLAVTVSDSRSGAQFVLGAENDNALDVFDHPYVHAAFQARHTRHRNSDGTRPTLLKLPCRQSGAIQTRAPRRAGGDRGLSARVLRSARSRVGEGWALLIAVINGPTRIRRIGPRFSRSPRLV
jgi:hypothetical protein